MISIHLSSYLKLTLRSNSIGKLVSNLSSAYHFTSVEWGHTGRFLLLTSPSRPVIFLLGGPSLLYPLVDRRNRMHHLEGLLDSNLIEVH
jgi:hypothetical protein